MANPRIIGGPHDDRSLYPDHRDLHGQLMTETLIFTQLKIPDLNDPHAILMVTQAYRYLLEGKPEIYRYHLHIVLEMQFRHCNHDIYFLLKPDFPTADVVCDDSQQDRPFPRAYDQFPSSTGYSSAITLTARPRMIYDGGNKCKFLPLLVVEITAEENKAADALARAMAGMQAWYETCRTGYGVVCVGMRYWRLVHGVGKLVYLEQEPTLSPQGTDEWLNSPAAPVVEVLLDRNLFNKIPNSLVREVGHGRMEVERKTMSRLMYHITCASMAALKGTTLQTVMKPFLRLKDEGLYEAPSDLIDPSTVYSPRNTDLSETLTMLSTYGLKVKIVTPRKMDVIVADISRKFVSQDVEAQAAVQEVQDMRRLANGRAAASSTPTSISSGETGSGLPSNTSKTLVIGAIITHPSDPSRVLLVKRPAGETLFPGRWEIPGGKAEYGVDQTLLETVVRKAKEETGMRVTAVKGEFEALEFEWSEGRCKQYNFVVDGEGEVTLNPEKHDEWRWVREGSWRG